MVGSKGVVSACQNLCTGRTQKIPAQVRVNHEQKSPNKWLVEVRQPPSITRPIGCPRHFKDVSRRSRTSFRATRRSSVARDRPQREEVQVGARDNAGRQFAPWSVCEKTPQKTLVHSPVNPIDPRNEHDSASITSKRCPGLHTSEQRLMMKVFFEARIIAMPSHKERTPCHPSGLRSRRHLLIHPKRFPTSSAILAP